jgi:CDP-glycerol glycerophosphotransferase (TagB/SpsB family)
MKFLLYLSQNYSFEILRPLCSLMHKEGHDVRWFVEGSEVNKSQFQPDDIVLSTISEAISFQPDASFLPGNIVPSFIPGLKVQLFHGFEWKKKGHFRIRGCFDLYCTQGPFFTEKFEALREKHPHFTVKETGWTKLDTLFQRSRASISQSKPPVILYAPTFSPSFTSANSLFNEMLALSKNKSWKWKVKFHPKMDKETIDAFKRAQHENFEVIDSDSIIPLLVESDVMVSDTSSAITEFLLLGKSVVTFKNAQPEPMLIDIDDAKNLGDAVKKALAMDEALKESIKNYSLKMHPFTDGQSAQRVLKATIEEIERYPREENVAKPKNLFRNFKLRKRFGYWK